jgi:hypothetical protein
MIVNCWKATHDVDGLKCCRTGCETRAVECVLYLLNGR